MGFEERERRELLPEEVDMNPKLLSGLCISVGLLGAMVGCRSKGESAYAECVKLEARGDFDQAWVACEAAVSDDPLSPSGRAASEKLSQMKLDKARRTPTAAPDSPAAAASAGGPGAGTRQPRSDESLAKAVPGRRPYGVMMSIPKEFTKAKEVENGDSFIETYKSPGIASLTITKSYFSEDEPNLGAAWKKAIEPSSVFRITYKQKGQTWFVVSGFLGELVVYTKVIASGDRRAQFTMTFPEDERSLYDDLLSPMERSFKIVDL